MSTYFQKSLKESSFLFTFELVPGRSVRTRQYQETIRFLLESQKERLFHAFSITDNAGGNPALSPIPLGKTIKSLGLEPIIHISCKDKNRNQLESELLSLDREGLHNLLVLTGDYPLAGFLGKGKPVFDFDSVLLLQMITALEMGLDGRPPIPFFKGAVINPFKLEISEVWLQYLKLYKKLKNGAYFIISQVGFYPRKWLELKVLLESGITRIFSKFFEEAFFFSQEEDEAFSKVPLIGSVLYLTPSLLKVIKKGKIPGIILTSAVMEKLSKAFDFEEESLDIAAKLTAILKGLGFRGVHLCGFPLDYEKLHRFFEKFYHYESHWEEFFHEFDGKALVEKDHYTLKKDLPCLIKEDFDFSFKGRKSLFFYFNEGIHRLFFEEKSPLYPLFKRLAEFIDKRKTLKRYFTGFEYLVKKLLFNCQECGDCTLYEFNYHCPQSGCAKYLLNGPCGGSLNGYCEVYPFERKCHFVKAFESAPSKAYLKKFFKKLIYPRKWELYKTSSWLNFYLKRDHHSYQEKRIERL